MNKDNKNNILPTKHSKKGSGFGFKSIFRKRKENDESEDEVTESLENIPADIFKRTNFDDGADSKEFTLQNIESGNVELVQHDLQTAHQILNPQVSSEILDEEYNNETNSEKYSLTTKASSNYDNSTSSKIMKTAEKLLPDKSHSEYTISIPSISLPSNYTDKSQTNIPKYLEVCATNETLESHSQSSISASYASRITDEELKYTTQNIEKISATSQRENIRQQTYIYSVNHTPQHFSMALNDNDIERDTVIDTTISEMPRIVNQLFQMDAKENYNKLSDKIHLTKKRSISNVLGKSTNSIHSIGGISEVAQKNTAEIILQNKALEYKIEEISENKKLPESVNNRINKKIYSLSSLKGREIEIVSDKNEKILQIEMKTVQSIEGSAEVNLNKTMPQNEYKIASEINILNIQSEKKSSMPEEKFDQELLQTEHKPEIIQESHVIRLKATDTNLDKNLLQIEHKIDLDPIPEKCFVEKQLSTVLRSEEMNRVASENLTLENTKIDIEKNFVPSIPQIEYKIESEKMYSAIDENIILKDNKMVIGKSFTEKIPQIEYKIESEISQTSSLPSEEMCSMMNANLIFEDNKITTEKRFVEKIPQIEYNAESEITHLSTLQSKKVNSITEENIAMENNKTSTGKNFIERISQSEYKIEPEMMRILTLPSKETNNSMMDKNPTLELNQSISEKSTVKRQAQIEHETESEIIRLPILPSVEVNSVIEDNSQLEVTKSEKTFVKLPIEHQIEPVMIRLSNLLSDKDENTTDENEKLLKIKNKYLQEKIHERIPSLETTKNDTKSIMTNQSLLLRSSNFSIPQNHQKISSGLINKSYLPSEDFVLYSEDFLSIQDESVTKSEYLSVQNNNFNRQVSTKYQNSVEMIKSYLPSEDFENIQEERFDEKQQIEYKVAAELTNKSCLSSKDNVSCLDHFLTTEKDNFNQKHNKSYLPSEDFVSSSEDIVKMKEENLEKNSKIEHKIPTEEINKSYLLSEDFTLSVEDFINMHAESLDETLEIEDTITNKEVNKSYLPSEYASIKYSDAKSQIEHTSVLQIFNELNIPPERSNKNSQAESIKSTSTTEDDVKISEPITDDTLNNKISQIGNKASSKVINNRYLPSEDDVSFRSITNMLQEKIDRKLQIDPENTNKLNLILEKSQIEYETESVNTSHLPLKESQIYLEPGWINKSNLSMENTRTEHSGEKLLKFIISEEDKNSNPIPEGINGSVYKNVDKLLETGPKDVVDEKLHGNTLLLNDLVPKIVDGELNSSSKYFINMVTESNLNEKLKTEDEFEENSVKQIKLSENGKELFQSENKITDDLFQVSNTSDLLQISLKNSNYTYISDQVKHQDDVDSGEDYSDGYDYEDKNYDGNDTESISNQFEKMKQKLNEENVPQNVEIELLTNEIDNKKITATRKKSDKFLRNKSLVTSESYTKFPGKFFEKKSSDIFSEIDKHSSPVNIKTFALEDPMDESKSNRIKIKSLNLGETRSNSKIISREFEEPIKTKFENYKHKLNEENIPQNIESEIAKNVQNKDSFLSLVDVYTTMNISNKILNPFAKNITEMDSYDISILSSVSNVSSVIQENDYSITEADSMNISNDEPPDAIKKESLSNVSGVEFEGKSQQGEKHTLESGTKKSKKTTKSENVKKFMRDENRTYSLSSIIGIPTKQTEKDEIEKDKKHDKSSMEKFKSQKMIKEQVVRLGEIRYPVKIEGLSKKYYSEQYALENIQNKPNIQKVKYEEIMEIKDVNIIPQFPNIRHTAKAESLPEEYYSEECTLNKVETVPKLQNVKYEKTMEIKNIDESPHFGKIEYPAKTSGIPREYIPEKNTLLNDEIVAKSQNVKYEEVMEKSNVQNPQFAKIQYTAKTEGISNKYFTEDYTIKNTTTDLKMMKKSIDIEAVDESKYSDILSQHIENKDEKDKYLESKDQKVFSISTVINTPSMSTKQDQSNQRVYSISTVIEPPSNFTNDNSTQIQSKKSHFLSNVAGIFENDKPKISKIEYTANIEDLLKKYYSENSILEDVGIVSKLQNVKYEETMEIKNVDTPQITQIQYPAKTEVLPVEYYSEKCILNNIETVPKLQSIKYEKTMEIKNVDAPYFGKIEYPVNAVSIPSEFFAEESTLLSNEMVAKSQNVKYEEIMEKTNVKDPQFPDVQYLANTEGIPNKYFTEDYTLKNTTTDLNMMAKFANIEGVDESRHPELLPQHIETIDEKNKYLESKDQKVFSLTTVLNDPLISKDPRQDQIMNQRNQRAFSISTVIDPTSNFTNENKNLQPLSNVAEIFETDKPQISKIKHLANIEDLPQAYYSENSILKDVTTVPNLQNVRYEQIMEINNVDSPQIAKIQYPAKPKILPAEYYSEKCTLNNVETLPKLQNVIYEETMEINNLISPQIAKIQYPAKKEVLPAEYYSEKCTLNNVETLPKLQNLKYEEIMEIKNLDSPQIAKVQYPAKAKVLPAEYYSEKCTLNNVETLPKVQNVIYEETMEIKNLDSPQIAKVQYPAKTEVLPAEYYSEKCTFNNVETLPKLQNVKYEKTMEIKNVDSPQIAKIQYPAKKEVLPAEYYSGKSTLNNVETVPKLQNIKYEQTMEIKNEDASYFGKIEYPANAVGIPSEFFVEKSIPLNNELVAKLQNVKYEEVMEKTNVKNPQFPDVQYLANTEGIPNKYFTEDYTLKNTVTVFKMMTKSTDIEGFDESHHSKLLPQYMKIKDEKDKCLESKDQKVFSLSTVLNVPSISKSEEPKEDQIMSQRNQRAFSISTVIDPSSNFTNENKNLQPLSNIAEIFETDKPQISKIKHLANIEDLPQAYYSENSILKDVATVPKLQNLRYEQTMEINNVDSPQIAKIQYPAKLKVLPAEYYSEKCTLNNVETLPKLQNVIYEETMEINNLVSPQIAKIQYPAKKEVLPAEYYSEKCTLNNIETVPKLQNVKYEKTMEIKNIDESPHFGKIEYPAKTSGIPREYIPEKNTLLNDEMVAKSQNVKYEEVMEKSNVQNPQFAKIQYTAKTEGISNKYFTEDYTIKNTTTDLKMMKKSIDIETIDEKNKYLESKDQKVFSISTVLNIPSMSSNKEPKQDQITNQTNQRAFSISTVIEPPSNLMNEKSRQVQSKNLHPSSNVAEIFEVDKPYISKIRHLANIEGLPKEYYSDNFILKNVETVPNPQDMKYEESMEINNLDTPKLANVEYPVQVEYLPKDYYSENYTLKNIETVLESQNANYKEIGIKTSDTQKSGKNEFAAEDSLKEYYLGNYTLKNVENLLKPLNVKDGEKMVMTTKAVDNESLSENYFDGAKDTDLGYEYIETIDGKIVKYSKPKGASSLSSLITIPLKLADEVSLLDQDKQINSLSYAASLSENEGNNTLKYIELVLKSQNVKYDGNMVVKNLDIPPLMKVQCPANVEFLPREYYSENYTLKNVESVVQPQNVKYEETLEIKKLDTSPLAKVQCPANAKFFPMEYYSENYTLKNVESVVKPQNVKYEKTMEIEQLDTPPLTKAQCPANAVFLPREYYSANFTLRNIESVAKLNNVKYEELMEIKNLDIPLSSVKIEYPAQVEGLSKEYYSENDTLTNAKSIDKLQNVKYEETMETKNLDTLLPLEEYYLGNYTLKNFETVFKPQQVEYEETMKIKNLDIASFSSTEYPAQVSLPKQYYTEDYTKTSSEMRQAVDGGNFEESKDSELASDYKEPINEKSVEPLKSKDQRAFSLSSLIESNSVNEVKDQSKNLHYSSNVVERFEKEKTQQFSKLKYTTIILGLPVQYYSENYTLKNIETVLKPQKVKYEEMMKIKKLETPFAKIEYPAKIEGLLDEFYSGKYTSRYIEILPKAQNVKFEDTMVKENVECSQFANIQYSAKTEGIPIKYFTDDYILRNIGIIPKMMVQTVNFVREENINMKKVFSLSTIIDIPQRPTENENLQDVSGSNKNITRKVSEKESLKESESSDKKMQSKITTTTTNTSDHSNESWIQTEIPKYRLHFAKIEYPAEFVLLNESKNSYDSLSQTKDTSSYTANNTSGHSSESVYKPQFSKIEYPKYHVNMVEYLYSSQVTLPQDDTVSQKTIEADKTDIQYSSKGYIPRYMETLSGKIVEYNFVSNYSVPKQDDTLGKGEDIIVPLTYTESRATSTKPTIEFEAEFDILHRASTYSLEAFDLEADDLELDDFDTYPSNKKSPPGETVIVLPGLSHQKLASIKSYEKTKTLTDNDKPPNEEGEFKLIRQPTDEEIYELTSFVQSTDSIIVEPSRYKSKSVDLEKLELLDINEKPKRASEYSLLEISMWSVDESSKARTIEKKKSCHWTSIYNRAPNKDEIRPLPYYHVRGTNTPECRSDIDITDFGDETIKVSHSYETVNKDLLHNLLTTKSISKTHLKDDIYLKNLSKQPSSYSFNKLLRTYCIGDICETNYLEFTNEPIELYYSDTNHISENILEKSFQVSQIASPTIEPSLLPTNINEKQLFIPPHPTDKLESEKFTLNSPDVHNKITSSDVSGGQLTAKTSHIASETLVNNNIPKDDMSVVNTEKSHSSTLKAPSEDIIDYWSKDISVNKSTSGQNYAPESLSTIPYLIKPTKNEEPSNLIESKPSENEKMSLEPKLLLNSHSSGQEITSVLPKIITPLEMIKPISRTLTIPILTKIGNITLPEIITEIPIINKTKTIKPSKMIKTIRILKKIRIITLPEITTVIRMYNKTEMIKLSETTVKTSILTKIRINTSSLEIISPAEIIKKIETITAISKKISPEIIKTNLGIILPPIKIITTTKPSKEKIFVNLTGRLMELGIIPKDTLLTATPRYSNTSSLTSDQKTKQKQKILLERKCDCVDKTKCRQVDLGVKHNQQKK